QREAHVLRERSEMRGAEAAVAVVDPVEVLDQEIALARRVAEERAHFRERLRVDDAALGSRADFPLHARAYYRPSARAVFLTAVKLDLTHENPTAGPHRRASFRA